VTAVLSVNPISDPQPRWICCQLGAREHYSIPRALYGLGQLRSLVTDAWMLPGDWGGQLPGLRRLGDRFHPTLATAPVTAFTPALLRFEATHRVCQTPHWLRTVARNQWFQAHAGTALRHLAATDPRPHILFSYSYAGLQLGQIAQELGWPFVLGQIDPGVVDEQRWQAVPDAYWDDWRAECALATQILVNSPWSEESLVAEGVPPEKLRVVPLAYEPEGAIAQAQQTFQRQYPAVFSGDRPLRVLFLGQAIPRKGIKELLEAAELLQGQPVEFWIVGAASVELQAAYPNPVIRWLGAVPRSATHSYYQQADVFLFPTHSDGFGLTQLEAQAWNLPLITSRFCGSVVTEQGNGWVLPEVTPEAIAHILRHCLQFPACLTHAAAHTSHAPEFRLPHLQTTLQQLTQDLLPSR